MPERAWLRELPSSGRPGVRGSGGARPGGATPGAAAFGGCWGAVVRAVSSDLAGLLFRVLLGEQKKVICGVRERSNAGPVGRGTSCWKLSLPHRLPGPPGDTKRAPFPKGEVEGVPFIFILRILSWTKGAS